MVLSQATRIVTLAAVLAIGVATPTYGAHSLASSASLANALPNFLVPKLSQEERDGLVYMREEEKLARDVYNVFTLKWGARPFGNIAQSEQTHMDAVKVLLDRYGLDDPAARTRPGVFKNPELQALYTKLVARGGASRIEALKVGALIEDLDLYDLERWLKVTVQPDIKLVYENLAMGSRNHLRAFITALGNSGGSYVPRYLAKADFDKIVAAPMERGGRGPGSGPGRGRRGGGG